MTADLAPASQEAFLDGIGWADAARMPLTGDASARAYLRLTREAGETAILMRAPVDAEADRDSLAAFLRVGRHLAALGLSAPEVIAVDLPNGLILMEDFGDATLARLLAADPAAAQAAYAVSATDMLAILAAAPVPDWAARPDAAAQAGMIDLTLGLLPEPAAVAGLRPALAEALERHCPGPYVLSLRDCHGDNLIWLPARRGASRIGLLDYQDAVALPLGYDLASLVDDPRRDLPEGWRADLIARFAAAFGLPLAEAEARVATLSLLRNLRILGIFHRLATQMGKPQYRAFLPRTGRLIDRAVDHPALADLRAPVADLRRQTQGWAA
jgi:aminoglycoside/choline kinase family phosphotransferase